VLGGASLLRAQHRSRWLLGVVAAGALAIAGAAVQLGPALEHAPLSPRGLGVTYEMASSYAWPSWHYLISLLLPTFYGDVARGSYSGAPDQWELCGYGVGVTATLLALLSLVESHRRGERVALLLLTVAACDLARGPSGVLHPWCYAHVPLYTSLRCPARALYVWTLTAPLLAADGYDALIARLPQRPRRWLAPALVCAVAVELLIVWRAENPSTSAATANARPAAAELLRAHASTGRSTNEVHLPQPFHNCGLSWGIESAGGYSSLPIWRYVHLLWIANHNRVYPGARLNHDLSAQGLWRFSSPIVDLLGVTWIVAGRHRPPDAPDFRLVFSGADGIDVWKNPHALPRAFVVPAVRVVPDDAAAAQALTAHDFAPDRFAVVEQPITDVPLWQPSSANDSAPQPTAVTKLSRRSTTAMSLAVDLKRPGVLVLSEPWYPGWQSRVDGVAQPVLQVDYALSGVALPSGQHVVEVWISNLAFSRGARVSLAAFALFVLLVLRVVFTQLKLRTSRAQKITSD
jgi:hypothetical protein